MSKAANRHGRRTATADLALQRARLKADQLRNDPAECVRIWDRIALPCVAPDQRAEARVLFRTNIHDAEFRRAFVQLAYEGAVELYESGELD
jgi:hypothetical protein